MEFDALLAVLGQLVDLMGVVSFLELLESLLPEADWSFLTALTMDQIGTMIFARSIFPKSITEVALTIVD